MRKAAKKPNPQAAALAEAMKTVDLIQHKTKGKFAPGFQPGAGRKTLYTPELAKEICDHISQGGLLIEWCKQPGRPDRGTIWNWLDKHPDFATAYARARELAADAMDELMMEEAKAASATDANLASVRIKTYQWRAARMNRKRYADHTTTDINQTIRNETPIDLSKLPADVREQLRITLEKQIAAEQAVEAEFKEIEK